MKPAVKIDLPYLSREKNRHGTEVLFVRRFGRRVRIREQPGTPEFLKAYGAALSEISGRRPIPASAAAKPAWPPKSFGALAVEYFYSDEFKALPPDSQATRRGVIEDCLAEPFTEDDADPMGNCPLDHLTAPKIKRLRDLKTKAGWKGAANNRKKYLSSMFGWAIERDPPRMTSNPARDVKRVRYATDGFHTWTREEVEQFRARHPVGTKPRLALEMLLFIGCRKGDFVTLGKQHRKGNALHFVTRKTRHKRRRMSVKPIVATLADVLDKTPLGDLTFLVTSFNKPFTAKGFGNWFRDQCDAAGLPQCTAHGLRKIGATIAAELGASAHTLMAMYDWESIKVAQIYTEAADRKRLAEQGMPLLERAIGSGT